MLIPAVSEDLIGSRKWRKHIITVKFILSNTIYVFRSLSILSSSNYCICYFWVQQTLFKSNQAQESASTISKAGLTWTSYLNSIAQQQHCILLENYCKILNLRKGNGKVLIINNTKNHNNTNLPNIVFGCAVKMDGSTTNLSVIHYKCHSFLMFLHSELLLLHFHTQIPFPQTILQLLSELDWLLFLLLFPALLLDPSGDTFWGRGLLGRGTVDLSRSEVELNKFMQIFF